MRTYKKEENPITTLSTTGIKQLIQFLLPLLSYTHLCSNHKESLSPNTHDDLSPCTCCLPWDSILPESPSSKKKKKLFFHLLKFLLIHQGPAHTGTAQCLIRPLRKHPSGTYNMPLLWVPGVPQCAGQCNCIHPGEGDWGREWTLPCAGREQLQPRSLKSSAGRCHWSCELKTPVSRALREVLCSEHWKSNQ